MLKERLAAVEERIAAACARANRKREEVKVIAVTKYVDADTIGDLLAIGVEHIGENRVQDALPKFERYGHLGTWHFIGHLRPTR